MSRPRLAASLAAIPMLLAVPAAGTAETGALCVGAFHVAGDDAASLHLPGAVVGRWASRDLSHLEPAYCRVPEAAEAALPPIPTSECDALGNCNSVWAKAQPAQPPAAHGAYDYCHVSGTPSPGTPCDYWGRIQATISSVAAPSGRTVLEGSPGMSDVCAFTQPSTNACTAQDSSILFTVPRGTMHCVRATSTATFAVQAWWVSGAPVVGGSVSATADCW